MKKTKPQLPDKISPNGREGYSSDLGYIEHKIDQIIDYLASREEPPQKQSNVKRSSQEVTTNGELGRIIDRTDRITERELQGYPQPEVQEECINCQYKPWGAIRVDDVNDPHCSDCGRKLTPPLPKQQGDWEWQDKFRLEFGPGTFTGRSTERNLIKFISKELDQARTKEREEIVRIIEVMPAILVDVRFRGDDKPLIERAVSLPDLLSQIRKKEGGHK